MPELAGQRLDQVVPACSMLSRRRVRALAADGRVWVNQAAVRVLSRSLQVGDVVDVMADGDELQNPARLPEPLPIVFEDSWILAVDKTYGLATQAPARRRPDELTAHELALVQLAAREGRRMELLLLHRLDRLTTGVLVFARSHDAARSLSVAWAGGQAHKRYLAIVDGDPGAGERRVDGPVGRDPLVPGRFRVTERGKPASSLVRRLHTTGAVSLVEVSPLSGRTHQVRLHLAHLGTPVAADTLYGGSGGVARPFLHAWRLALPHPHTGHSLDLVSPLPVDMRAAARELGLSLDTVLA